MTKRQRQRVIQQVVRERPIGSQLQLVEALSSMGLRVTQATISRDLRELGLQRGRDPSGRTRYVSTPGTEEKPDTTTACRRMLQEFGRGVQPAQNLIVLRCDPGAAPGLGRVVDELERADILGCVAGDDTVIIVTEDAATAHRVAAFLRELGG